MELTRDVQAGDKHFFTSHSAGSHLLRVGDVLHLLVDPGSNREIVKGEIVEITPTEITWKLV